MIRYQGFTKDEVFALMCANAPNPSEAHVDIQLRMDMAKNPHGDPPPKPRRRTQEEIVADYKIGHAKALMKAVEKELSSKM